MGILQRLFNLFRSNANDLLDKAEDPEKMLQQMLADLEVQKRKAKQQMTEALALQKGLERDTEKEHKEADKWEQKAVLAVQNEKDDLAKEALSELTNHSIGDVAPLSSTTQFIQRLENINEWSAQAIPANYSLMALRKAIEAAQSYIDQVSAEHLPLLELQLTKQKSNIGYEFAVSPTTTSEVATLNFTLPLFSGGQTTARVYEAYQELELSKAEYEIEKRRVIKEARDTFLVVNALSRRIEAVSKEVESAQKSSQAMNRSFELGIATVSQVLDAQKDFSEAKRAHQIAKYTYINSKAELLQISGKLNDDAIYEISKWLQ